MSSVHIVNIRSEKYKHFKSEVVNGRVSRQVIGLKNMNGGKNNKQLLDEVEKNIVICQWRADQLFADAEGKGK